MSSFYFLVFCNCDGLKMTTNSLPLLLSRGGVWVASSNTELGHVTWFVQWAMSQHDSSRSLISTYAVELVFLELCFEVAMLKGSWGSLLEDERLRSRGRRGPGWQPAPTSTRESGHLGLSSNSICHLKSLRVSPGEASRKITKPWALIHNLVLSPKSGI